MDNDPYKMKLSVLRYQVSQQLIAASGLLKDTTKLLKNFTETPSLALNKSVKNNILKSGETLNELNNLIQVLKKRIEHIADNFKGNAEETEAVKSLMLDIPQNTQNMSMLKKHYLEIVGLYAKDEKSREEYCHFNFFNDQPEPNIIELDKRHTNDIVIKSKPKKNRLSWF